MICLIGCVKSKRKNPSRAEDLYISPLFRYRLAYAKKRGCQIFILSAKHGLVDPDQIIAPYDETLNDKTDLEIKKWSYQICRSLEDRKLISAGGGCMILAGANYYRYLSRRYKMINPTQGLSIGRQLSFFKNEGR